MLVLIVPFLCIVAAVLLVYVIIKIRQEKKFTVADALAALGTVVAIIIALVVKQTTDNQSPSSTSGITTQTTTILPNVTATSIPVVNQEKWICTGENVVAGEEHVTIERMGSCRISLVAGGVIVGTADRFQEDVDLPENPQPPCTAFAINGPIEMDVRIWWGGWDYHTNLDEASIGIYLEQKKAECERNHPDRDVKVVRLP